MPDHDLKLSHGRFEILQDTLDLGLELLVHPELYVFRMIETASVSDRIVGREVIKEFHVPSVLRDQSAPTTSTNLNKSNEATSTRCLVPLASRDKDNLIDNLTITNTVSVTVLPRQLCQQIAQYALLREWLLAFGDLEEPYIPFEFVGNPDYRDSREEFFLQMEGTIGSIPALNVEQAETAYLWVLQEMLFNYGIEKVRGQAGSRFLSWLAFYVYSHVIWTIVQVPRSSEEMKIEYKFHTPFAPARRLTASGVRKFVRLNSSSANVLRFVTTGPLEASSYHFRMQAPTGRYFISQRIRRRIEGGHTETLVEGPRERPYAHLYSGHTERRIGRPVWISLRMMEAPPWSSSRVAAISGLSLLLVSLLGFRYVTTPGDTVAPGAATLLLALPAAAAFWVGAPTSHELITNLPLLSRFLLISSGVVSVVTAAIVANFGQRPAPSFEGIPEFEFSSIDEINPYLTIIVILGLLQAAIAITAVWRTFALRNSSRLLRFGPPNANIGDI